MNNRKVGCELAVYSSSSLMNGVSAARPTLSASLFRCNDCGATAAREVLREQLSYELFVVRWACTACAAEHTCLTRGQNGLTL